MVNQRYIFIQDNTYTRESNSAVTTFGCGGEFTDRVVDEFSTGGFDHSAAVGGGVVRLTFTEGYTLSHCELLDSIYEPWSSRNSRLTKSEYQRPIEDC